jgi:hypothetical protein
LVEDSRGWETSCIMGSLMPPVTLKPNGIDVWYIDESGDQVNFAVTGIAIPLLRPTKHGEWAFVWDDWLRRAIGSRKLLHNTHRIPSRKELHAVKLVAGRGRYRDGKRRFTRPAGCAVYQWMMSNLDWLPPSSVISVAGTASSQLYGHTRLEASMYGLFQRMERHSKHQKTTALAFFDAGHGEYRKLFRKARRFLPTGSKFGNWGTKSSTNIPMESFLKDANFKDSRHCIFTQIADLLAYGVFLKAKHSAGSLAPWQAAAQLETAYDRIPSSVINQAANSRRHPDGIVWLR